MQDWSAASVAFLRDAAAYGDFFPKLAAHLLPWLPKDGHICDAGCGLGSLALELCRYCQLVTAVDLAAAAIEALCAEVLPENLRVVCGDIFTMSAQYDAMVFCYFGRMREILQIAAHQCTGRVVAVKRANPAHRFSVQPAERDRHRQEEAHALLTTLKIPFETQRLQLEFGQPFRSIEAASDFFALYDRSGAAIGTEELQRRLSQTQSAEFPYYLPSQRDMEIFIFDAHDIPEEFL